MSAGAALTLGVAVGLATMVSLMLWVVVQGRLPARLPIVALAVNFVLVGVLAINSGTFKNALLVILGSMVGLAVSSLITLPLAALARRRHG